MSVEEKLDEILRLSRENHAALEELVGYKRRMEYQKTQDYNIAREFAVNMLANLMVSGGTNINNTRL